MAYCNLHLIRPLGKSGRCSNIISGGNYESGAQEKGSKDYRLAMKATGAHYLAGEDHEQCH